MARGKQWVDQELTLDDVRVHKTMQHRVKGLDTSNLNKIIRVLEDGGETRDPIRVARVGKALYLVDGFHRREAYRRAHRTFIPSLVAKMSLEEAQDYARVANAANGKSLSRLDKNAIWETCVAEGRHLDPATGVPKSSRVIERELGYIWSHTTIRTKLRELDLELDEDVEYDGHYKPFNDLSEDDLEQERVEEAEDAVGTIGGLLPTLATHDQKRLIGVLKVLLDAIERGDEVERESHLELLRGPELDI